MTNATSDTLEEIAAIIRRVGKREEVENEIAENVSFSELISDQIKTPDSPVREAAIRVIINYVKDMEITSEDDAAQEILEAIDFKKLVPSMLQNKDFQKSVESAIENMFDNGDLDLSSSISDALGDEELKKIMSTETMRTTVAEKLKSYVEDFDMSDLGEDFYTKLDDIIFSKERVEEVIKKNSGAIEDLLMKQIESQLENASEDDSDNPIFAAISESKIFQSAVDKAIEDLVDSGRVTRLVEKVAQDMLSGDDSNLRNQLTTAISEQLTQKIASSIVAQALK
jgi:hypothetical protein